MLTPTKLFLPLTLHKALQKIAGQGSDLTPIGKTSNDQLEENEDEDKAKKITILKDYNKYLLFLEKYFSNKNAEPLPTGSELAKIIFD